MPEKKAIKPVMTLSYGDEKTEVYLINPGESFPGFGGGRHSLLITGTASLITRSIGPNGLRDTEYNIDDPKIWTWISKLINQRDGVYPVAQT